MLKLLRILFNAANILILSFVVLLGLILASNFLLNHFEVEVAVGIIIAALIIIAGPFMTIVDWYAENLMKNL